MTYRELKRSYVRRLKEKGIDPKNMNAIQVVETGIDYYSEQRVFACHLEKDDDMLLFQWGTYNWGKGEFFEVDLTRQVIVFGEMYQMHVTAFYKTSEVTNGFGSGNKWCSNLGEIDGFVDFIDGTEILKALSKMELVKSVIEFGAV